METQKPVINRGFLVLGLIVILFLVGALFLVPKILVQKNETPTTITEVTENTTPAPEASPSSVFEQPKVYLMAEVKAHADAGSCWTVVRGNVYDVTVAIDIHKGGRDKILGLCGIDGTSAFETKHGGQEKPKSWLETLKIGTLQQ